MAHPTQHSTAAPHPESEPEGTTVWLISGSGAEHRTTAEIPELLRADDGVVWMDVAACDEDAVRVLAEGFGFHPLAVQDCTQRNPIPKLHVYTDHVFEVLHAPERGTGGHVHYLELDLFVGPHYLVTVHGPLNPRLDPSIALGETRAVAERLAAGRLHPVSGAELAAAVVAGITRRLLRLLEELTADVWDLERRVTAGHFGDAEQFLEEMFRVRHGLMTVGTMALLNHEVYGRMATLQVFGRAADRASTSDIVDQFGRIATMAEGQKAYIQGVIEFYQTRTNTKMTIAAERLAVIAGVTLPITALSSVLGMNVIVNAETEWRSLAVILVVMVAMSALMLAWARRKGWW